MFDANARGIPQGRKFFVEAHSINRQYKTYRKLLKKGEVYLCEKIEGDEHEVIMHLYLNSTCRDYIVIKENFHEEDCFDYDSLFVYSGRPDGSGFLKQEQVQKQKALDFLGGEWL
ncbi:conserved hypothetical protein [Vibrio phage 496E54-1]|nr:conserved hypothetical protein [Vibrio phage 495E54-1]CAH9013772.1 conserved hypothetical protein [Vibrio phage 496E54-1]